MKVFLLIKSVPMVFAGLTLALWIGSVRPQKVHAAPQDEPRTARYTVTDLGPLPGGAYSFAYGINNAGVVAGAAATASQTDFISQTAVLWYGGLPPINLGTLGGKECPDCSSEAGGPNAAGVSALLSETAEKVEVFVDGVEYDEDFCGFGTHRQCLAAIWENGVLTKLPLLSGGHNSQALWINNLGEVAGLSETGVQDTSCASMTPGQALRVEGVVWEPDGQIRELSPLSGDTVSLALGINDHG